MLGRRSGVNEYDRRHAHMLRNIPEEPQPCRAPVAQDIKDMASELDQGDSLSAGDFSAICRTQSSRSIAADS